MDGCLMAKLVYVSIVISLIANKSAITSMLILTK